LRREAEEDAERERQRLLQDTTQHTIEIAQIVTQPLQAFGDDFKRQKVVRRPTRPPASAEDIHRFHDASDTQYISAKARLEQDADLFASLLAQARATSQPLHTKAHQSPEKRARGHVADDSGRGYVADGSGRAHMQRDSGRGHVQQDSGRHDDVLNDSGPASPWRAGDSALAGVWGDMCELELESQAAGLGACFQWKQFPSAASGGVSGAGGSDQQTSKTAHDEALLSSLYCPVVLVPQPRMKAIYVLPTTQRATPLAPHVNSVRVPRDLSIDNAAGGLCGMHVEAQQQIEKERRLQSKDQTHLLNDAVSRDALESLKQYSLSRANININRKQRNEVHRTALEDAACEAAESKESKRLQFEAKFSLLMRPKVNKNRGMTVAPTLAATVEEGHGKGGVKAGKWGAAARALANGDLFILRSQSLETPLSEEASKSKKSAKIQRTTSTPTVV